VGATIALRRGGAAHDNESNVAPFGLRRRCHTRRCLKVIGVIHLLNGRIVVQPDQRRLLIEGVPARLGARAFDILMALIERRERPVGKHELLDLIWPGQVVEENNLQVHIWALRKLLGADTIATVPGRGYRFVAEPDLSADAATRAADEHAMQRPCTAAAAASAIEPVGRADELEQLLALTRHCRRVALVGAAGVGKTSLAAAAIACLQEDFVGGAVVLDLAQLESGASIEQAAAAEFSVAVLTRPAIVTTKRLLVLDNCEHRLDDAAAFAVRAEASGLHLLALGNQPLRVPGERVLRLEPLRVDDLHDASDLDSAKAHPAIGLFEKRVQALLPSFAVDAENLPAVIDINRALEGVPLQIELAAARVPLLGIEGLRVRLSEGLPVRVADAGLAGARCTSVPPALLWSHSQLTPTQQTVLHRLSVFAGGFDTQAAQAVVLDEALDADLVVDTVADLAQRSFLRVDRSAGPVPRYSMLDIVRRLSGERHQPDVATEAATVRSRHLHYFLRLAEDASAALDGPRQATWLQRLTLERDNLHAALGYCDGQGRGPELSLRLSVALLRWWLHAGLADRGYRETLRALHRPGANQHHVLRSRAQVQAGCLAAAGGAGTVALNLLRQGVALARACGEQTVLAQGLVHSTWVHLLQQDVPAASSTMEDAWDTARELGAPALLAMASNAAAELARRDGQLSVARAVQCEALRYACALGDRTLEWQCRLGMSLIALDEGDPVGVRNALAEALAICRELHAFRAAAEVGQVAAGMAALEGNDREAVLLHAATMAAPWRHDAADMTTVHVFVERSRRNLGPESALRCEAEGRSLGFKAALERVDARMAAGG
jgi:predicted ATPase/DNA-binding winged helix-turn-helix (wHTH) protein